MVSNGYPHMVFVQPDAGLDKESLAVFLEGLFPDADVTDKPLRVDMELGGYLFSFWLEEAEGVAERYATYLPEGARRRWLSRCASMIDLHGQPDPERTHEAKARRIVEALQAQDGIEVFSEETRRFLGMDYGDGTSSAPVPAAVPAQPAAPPAPGSDAVPAPHDIPAGEFAPRSAEPVAVPTDRDEGWTPEPWVPAPAASTPGSDASRDEPATVWMPAAPDPDRAVPSAAIEVPEAVSPETVPPPDGVPGGAAPAQPTPAAPPEADEPEKKGFFKRVFGRRPD